MLNRFRGAFAWSCRLALGVAVAALMAHGAHTVSAQAPQSVEQAGEPVPVISIVQASTAELMAMEPAPTAAAASGVDEAGTNVSVGTNFTAVTLQETSANPPDGHIAAGPTQLVVVANGRLRTFAKSTGAKDNVLDLAPNTFFSLVRAGGSTFGGRVRFDSVSSRWFVTMATDATPGRVVIAVSNGATISSATVWNFSGFDNTAFAPGNCAIDSPTLGLDASALYLGVNQFCSGVYAGTSAFVVRKTTTLSGTLAVTTFNNLTGTPTGAGPFSPMGVDSPDGSSAFGYFIGVDNSAFGRLVLRRVTDPGGTPTMSADIPLTVSSTALPVRVRHLGNTGGSTGELSGNDDRLSSATLRGGRIWTAHAIGVNENGTTTGPTRNGVRWYEIGAVDGTPVMLQSGTIFSSSGPGSVNERSYWNPSIAVTGQNRAVIGFSAAGANEYVNAGVAERLPADAVNAFGAPALYTSAASAYNPANDSGSAQGRRWGSYSSTVTDACDDITVWTVQEYTNAANSYALQVAKVQVAGPPVPVSANPSFVPHGRASFDVLINTGGSGEFFQSGAGFACRIAASISGVTVNQVTYLNATSVLLNLSTVGATPGAKTITVTNPDGQSATSSGTLMTVGEGSAPALSLDGPGDGMTVGATFTVTGWAVDQMATSGTGVDAVHVYAVPRNSDGSYGTATFLGVAAYGSARNDIGAAFGSQFTNSGFSFSASGLSSGVYRIDIYAHSSVINAFSGSRSSVVTVVGPVSSPLMAIDSPGNESTFGQSLTVSGWAVDRGAPTGTGVSQIHVYAFPLANGAVSGAPVFLGIATYGGARNDLGAVFGAQFTNCAFSLSATMPIGAYRVTAYALSTVANAFNHALSADVTIVAGASLPVMALDSPQKGATVSRPFNVTGWAIDRGATSGSGVSAIHVYAFPVGGGAPILVGYTTTSLSTRSDIAGIFGAQFANSGYDLPVSVLAPGVYDLYVFAQSTVTNSFNQATIARVTVQ